MAAVTYMLGVLFASQLWKGALRQRLRRRKRSRERRSPQGSLSALFIEGQVSSQRDDDNVPGLGTLHPAPDVDGIKGHGLKEYNAESRKVIAASASTGALDQAGSASLADQRSLVVCINGDAGSSSGARHAASSELPQLNAWR